MRWEYQSYLFQPGEQHVPLLCKRGEEGWEAFAIVTLDANGWVRVYFKRQIKDDAS